MAKDTNNGALALAILGLNKQGGGSGEPSAYIKSAAVSQDGNTLTLTKKDNTTVEFSPETGAEYTAGDGISINDDEIAVDFNLVTSITKLNEELGYKQDTLTAGEGIDITNNVISVDNTVAKAADIPTATSDLTNDSGFITASDIPSIPTKTSDLTNDSGFITDSYHDSTKQDTLTAGTNITIVDNVISATGGSGSSAWGSITGTITNQTDLVSYVANEIAGAIGNAIEGEY